MLTSLISINIQFSGGLGNQLFQYATGRAISLEKRAPLALDDWSGFARDRQYGRRFELSRVLIAYLKPSPIAVSCLWAYRATTSILGRGKINPIQRKWFGSFYSEPEFIFYPEVLSQDIKGLNWLVGYWQSPLYFQKHKKIILDELSPPCPSDQKFIDIGHMARNCNSVALGLRVYEESNNPGAHARAGKVKSAQEINDAIRRLTERVPNARFFIFCTHRASLLHHLNLPSSTVFVTAEDGFVDSIDCLWLLTQCKHHIFTNSSFYWWGAWLSEAVHPNTEQLIYAADNFINADGLCDHWHRF